MSVSITTERNLSGDLLWEVVRSNNAYLVKRKTNGGVQLSRDPFNLMNRHSRTQEGFVNDKAVSVQPSGDEKGVTLKTKKTKSTNKPASAYNSHTYSATTSTRRIHKSIADAVGKNAYRSDLRAHAVQRASAIRKSQHPKKETPEKKLRGAKARKAQA